MGPNPHPLHWAAAPGDPWEGPRGAPVTGLGGGDSDPQTHTDGGRDGVMFLEAKRIRGPANPWKPGESTD